MWNSLSDINLYENLLEQKEKEKSVVTREDVDFEKICRTCLRETTDSNNIQKEFEIGGMKLNIYGKTVKMVDMLQNATGLEVNDGDEFPQQICNSCIQNVTGSYFFRLQSSKAEITLRKLCKAMSKNFPSAKSKEDLNEDIEVITEKTSTTNKENKLLDHSDHSENEEVEIYNMDMDMEVEDNDECITEQNSNCEDSYSVRNSSIMESDNTTNVIEYEIEVIDHDEENEEALNEEVLNEDNMNLSTECDSFINCSDNSNTEEKITQQKTHTRGRRKSLNMTFRCAECGEIFKTNKNFQEHLSNVHPNSKAYECEVCNSKFSKLQTLRRHVKIHQADQRNKLCTYCGKAFIRADDLKRHIRTHTNERPYACSICPKRYKQNSELKEHLLTHSSDKKYHCELCSKSLHTRNGFYIHMKSHRGIKNHKCQMCSKDFVTSGELISHVRHIHDKKRPFSCSYKDCIRNFVTKASLQIHERSHTGERPYICTICNKKLATSSSLADHTRLHTEKKQIDSCKYCGKSFRNSLTLQRHTQKHVIQRYLEKHSKEGNKSEMVELGEEQELEEDEETRKLISQVQIEMKEERIDHEDGQLAQEEEQEELEQYSIEVYSCGICNQDFDNLEEYKKDAEQHIHNDMERSRSKILNRIK